MTAYVVSSGALSSGLVLLSGDTASVLGGGVAVSTSVSSGGQQSVRGETSSSLVSTGGVEIVESGGVARETVVSGGGVQRILAAGAASGSGALRR